MKMDKATQKELKNRIKDCAKKLGYKSSRGFLFSKNDDNFITVIPVIVDSCKLVYSIDIKKFSYDDIFWDVINMSDNKKQPVSLRAFGAFAAPSITIYEDEIALSSDPDSIANLLCDIIAEKTSKFLKEHQVNDYVLSNPYLKTTIS